MQTRLRARWSPPVAVGVTSLCFAVMHLDWLHGGLAFVLALYLGFITEVSGSALPAIACHVISNAVFTLLTALVGTLDAFWLNVVMLCGCALIVTGCVAWIRRSMPSLQMN
jgi:membrane protease YdiL (CAAX protease family)